MKKIFLSVALIMTVMFYSFGQSSETEPNNSFATANLIATGIQRTAVLDGTDTVDYHKLHFNQNANFYLTIEATNNGNSGTQSLQLRMYNTLRVSEQYIGNFNVTNFVVDEGETISQTILICGKAIDSFYLVFKSLGELDYNFEWYALNPYPNDGSNNNTLPTASPFSFNVEKLASVKYEFWGSVNFDTVDYFISTLPVANYDSVYLTIRGQNNSCGNGKWMNYICYKNGTPFASGYVGNNPSVNAYQEVYSSIPLTGMQAGDALHVKFAANAAFGYRFKYGILDEFEPDIEDNCCTYNAILLSVNIPASGNVGEYDYGLDEYVDEYDMYRIILPQDGAINIFIKGRNDQCVNGTNDLICDVLDKYGNYLDGTTLLTWDGGPACGQIKLDTIKLRAFAADTFYLRLTASEKVSYNIKYQLTDSTGSDANESYNNPVTTVLPISAGEVKKGHVRFRKDAYLIDASDIYKTTMPADGSITVYLKATHRVDYSGPNTSTNGRLSFITSGFTDRTPANPPVTNMTPDGVYLDTFLICGLGAGDLYFTLSSGASYEYEFRYVITDTSSLDNDVEPNNSFAEATAVGSGVLKKGHINYISNVTTDTYDYYKFIYNNNDSLKIPIQATNTSCENNKNIRIRGYNKNQVQIFTRLVANNSNVTAGQTIYDTVKIFVTAPDTIYLRFEATDAFKYEFTTNLRRPDITGDTTACFGTEIYAASNIGNTAVTYNWSLPAGGGSLTFVDSVATVTWNGTGNRSVQLYLSNALGNSQAKTLNVTVDSAVTTQAPVISNFARTLTASTRPAGTYVQWYRNGSAIANATDTVYYAALAGSFTAKFINNCGAGPVSNTYSFPADAIAQTISFPHTANQSMAPALKIQLPASASSGLPVYYTRISGPGTVIQDSLSITGVGTIIIKAQQPGDDVYSAATSKNDTIVVIKGNQLINFPVIPDRMYRNGNFTINPTSSVGLTISKSIVSGNASISGSTVLVTGAGNITVRASQAGNANYNAAVPVDRTFCVGIDTLSAIVGSTTVCLGAYTYTAQKIPGANYVWTLSGGGNMVTSNDTAFITWNTTGTHTLKVKANSSCNATYSFEPQKSITINNVTPTPVNNMFPVNNAQNQSLPLSLSWIPGDYTETYDLYVWDSAQAQPGVPYKSNITGISYTIPQSAFAYDNAYKWRLVSKNPCNQVSGPIQTFRLVPLPDLQVISVVAPTSAISGQTITISWTIRNNGPGNTSTNAVWQDAVYLTFDTTTNFSLNPEVLPHVWSNSNFPLRALILGSRNNVTALQSGQQYSNSINFTIPLSYSLPVYAYVITNKGNPGIVEVTRINDTARSQNPINITLAPTPDLRVDSLFTPSSTFSGSAVNISYKVKNYGSLTPAGASWQDVAYLSQSLLFDSSSAIKLNAPKTNGSYYPNTVYAGVTVNTQLQQDSFYYRNFQAVIPNKFFGTWFLHVKTNNNGSLYEGPSFINNTNNNAIQVYLTPTPKLTINSITLPVTQASITQPIGINWNIYNDGFRDNIEKNRGHYITMSTCHVGCGTGGNSICIAPSVIRDSVVFGSSYWLDRVYLSADSTGLNLSNAILVKDTTHGVQNSGLYADPNPSYVSCPAIVSGNVNVNNIINPGSNFPKTASFKIPSNLQAGIYYIYVWTNATKTVFEYPGTPEIKRTGALLIQRPDAVVSSISSPANAVTGQQIQIGYNITNNGPGTVYNHIRRDSIYISTSAVFNTSAQLIGTNIFTEDLPVGTPVPHSFNYTLHPSQSGTRYFFVRTNIDSAFRETNYTNNLSAATVTIFAPASPVDLVVTNVQAADTLVTVLTSKINYTVNNNGTGTAAGSWTDSLFVSCNNVFGYSTAYYIGKKQQTRTIAAGGNYTDSFSVNVPFTYNINNCFTQFNFNNGYFFVKANANGGVYEGANNNNNILGSSLKVLDNPLVDHIVTAVNSADSATVGQPYTIFWTVKNIGRNPIIDYDGRMDSVYISVDSVLNSNAVKTFRYKWGIKLEHDQTKNLSAGFNMVNVPAGNYYVFVKTNATKGIDAEKNYSNNVTLLRNASGVAKTIYITRPLLPDLIDSIISAPATIASGQPASIVYRITNIGLAPTSQNFIHLIRLSTDLNGNSNAAQLSFKTITARLQPGQFINDTVQVMIPNNLTPRVYTLFAMADYPYYSNITESNEYNNSDINFMTVFGPDSTDLIVSNVTTPDTIMLGYKMDSARWVIKNNSGTTAAGYSSDGIYLTQANEFDSSATLIGIKTRNLNMPPLDLDTLVHAPLVTGVTEGNYNMIIRTDLVNQLPELDESNNTTISAGQVYVKVKELALTVVENNTLATDLRFYKLIVPDSLNGATISVKLTSSDSLTRVNQMFIGKGFIPTAAHFDYTYPTANYGNQDIVMAYTTAGTYYIMIRAINPGTVVQNISLLARKLPFEISSVHTNAGGNIGNVTVKINGALFTPGMTAKLNKPGTEIIASAVYFTNTTLVYATFNLQGKPLGIYDVTLSKADTAFAVLVNGFSVVPANNGGVISGSGNNTGSGNGNAPGCDPGAASGLNSQLQTELLVPELVLRGWPFLIQINYNNPTNFDLPAQVRTLFAEDIIKMAFTREGVDNGVHSLTMELTETGGPPGIIRAGGSGSIVIFGKSDNDVPAHTFVLFKLQ